MPRLIDALGKMSVGNSQVNPSEIYKTAKMLPNKFPRPNLTIKNQLKTTIQIGDETAVSKLPGNSAGEKVFADWNKELNRYPKTDCFELQPINQVKQKTDDEIKNIQRDFSLSKWLQEVDERMKKLKLKP